MMRQPGGGVRVSGNVASCLVPAETAGGKRRKEPERRPFAPGRHLVRRFGHAEFRKRRKRAGGKLRDADTGKRGKRRRDLLLAGKPGVPVSAEDRIGSPVGSGNGGIKDRLLLELPPQ